MTGEPFGPLYEQPAAVDCPNCSCCTKRLCEQGRANAFGCVAFLADRDPDLVERVAACPCSAETTPGTEAYRAAQVRAAKRADRADDLDGAQ